MKVYYQWAVKTPTDWESVDLTQDVSGWLALPRLAALPSGQFGGQNNRPGLMFGLNLQGTLINWFDHYALERFLIPDDYGVRVTVWGDREDNGYGPGWRYAQVREYLRPAFDPVTGQINTRQSVTLYADPDYGALLTQFGVPWQPYSTFAPPENPVHGCRLSDVQEAAHLAVRLPHYWMEWR